MNIYHFFMALQGCLGGGGRCFLLNQRQFGGRTCLEFALLHASLLSDHRVTPATSSSRRRRTREQAETCVISWGLSSELVQPPFLYPIGQSKSCGQAQSQGGRVLESNTAKDWDTRRDDKCGPQMQSACLLRSSRRSGMNEHIETYWSMSCAQLTW